MAVINVIERYSYSKREQILAFYPTFCVMVGGSFPLL